MIFQKLFWAHNQANVHTNEDAVSEPVDLPHSLQPLTQLVSSHQSPNHTFLPHRAWLCTGCLPASADTLVQVFLSFYNRVPLSLWK